MADDQEQAFAQQRKRGPRLACGGAALLAGLSFILAACEYPGIPHPLAAQAEENGLPAPPAQASLTAQPAPELGSPETGDPPSTVEVKLADFALQPNRLTARAGLITFVLKNEGRYTHDFRIEGSGIDERAPKVGQGRTFQWEVTLPPGTYVISCPISNHADRGMDGALTVVE